MLGVCRVNGRLPSTNTVHTLSAAHMTHNTRPDLNSGIQGPRDFAYASPSWRTHTKNLSYGHRRLLLLSTYTCYTCYARYTRWWRKWRLQGPVGALRRVQEGRGGRDWMGVTDVLRMQELTLVGHDLRCLLAVQNREVGGHVDVYACIRRQAARGLGAQNGGWSRPRVRASGGGRGWGAGRGGCTGLTRGGAPWGHHWYGLQETPTPGGRLMFGAQAPTAANSDYWAKQDKRHEDWPHDQERHIDGNCQERKESEIEQRRLLCVQHNNKQYV